MKTLIQIIGIVIIIIGVVLGYFMDFSQDWMIEVIGAAVVFATLLVNKASEKTAWKVYLIGGIIFVGGVLAVVGGMTEATITSVIGAAIIIATVIGSLILTKINQTE